MVGFAELWDTELAERYPDFVFEDNFDNGNFEWHIHLREDYRKRLKKDMDKPGFMRSFHRFFRASLNLSYLFSGVVIYFEMYDSVAPITVHIEDDNGAPFEIQAETEEKYKVNLKGELPVTSADCVEIMKETGSFDVLIGVLDGLQKDAEKFKKYIDSAD